MQWSEDGTVSLKELDETLNAYETKAINGKDSSLSMDIDTIVNRLSFILNAGDQDYYKDLVEGYKAELNDSITSDLKNHREALEHLHMSLSRLSQADIPEEEVAQKAHVQDILREAYGLFNNTENGMFHKKRIVMIANILGLDIGVSLASNKTGWELG